MTTATATRGRTDVHRPAAPEFDPEAYDLRGVFDNDPEFGNNAARWEAVQGLLAEGYKAGPHGVRQCGHCGTRIRYAALMARADVKQWIYVGETCLEGRFDGLTKAEFQALRVAAKLNREQVTKAEKLAAAVQAQPMLAWLTYPQALDNSFLVDVGYKFCRDGELTERQVEAALAALVRETERADRARALAQVAAELVAAGVAVPLTEARIVIEGTVAATKAQESDYGTVYKMLVVTDEGWKVWGTNPAALDAEKGDRVRFTARVERSERDPLFGFFARPTKAEKLA